MNKNGCRILGIDPGLRKTGWAVVSLQKGNQISSASLITYIGCGSISTNKNTSHAIRLKAIFQEIKNIVENLGVQHAAIEETYVNTNYATSILLAQARAAAILGTMQLGIEPVPYQATTIKKAISGSGRADKMQVLKMLDVWISNFSVTDHNASDALAIAICHARNLPF